MKMKNDSSSSEGALSNQTHRIHLSLSTTYSFFLFLFLSIPPGEAAMFVMTLICPKNIPAGRGAARRGGETGATREDVTPERGTTLTPVEMITLKGGTAQE